MYFIVKKISLVSAVSSLLHLEVTIHFLWKTLVNYSV